MMLFQRTALLALLGLPAFQETPVPPERQIRWERTLEDALALAAETGRPLLVAVNTDAESACERIVREMYRDEDFVALSRRTVNVIASPWRHTLRDVDAAGRRVPCPRLGVVTCGEHVALEPVLFERFLGDERVAPRHAWIRPDGSKAFDLYFQFDLREVERHVRAQAEGLALPAPEALPAAPELLTDPDDHRAAVVALVRGRSSARRERLEAYAARAPAWAVGELLDVLASEGDRGALATVRRLLSRVDVGPAVAARSADLAAALDLRTELARALREDLAAGLTRPGESGLHLSSHLLLALAALEPQDTASRSLIASYAAAAVPGLEATTARRALGGLGEDLPLAPYPGPMGTTHALDPLGVLARYRASDPGPAPALDEDGRTAEELEAALVALESLSTEAALAADHQEALGRASLALARRRIAEGGAGIEFLLQDAERALARVLVEHPERLDLWLLRARIAYQESRFEDQESHAVRALVELESQGADGRDPRLQDALRWLADGAARMAATRAGGDPLVEIQGFLHGFHAAASAAASAAAASDTDWVTLSQVFGLVGRRREELAFCRQGLDLWPESNALRTALATAAWDVGRPEFALTTAVELVRKNPESAACHWYEGQARVGLAEVLRRAEAPRAALREYDRGAQAFGRSLTLEPAYATTVTDYAARIELGRGAAHLMLDERAAAAACLRAGIERLPAVRGVRDGLDREALDLLDGALEWRESGASPVDALELLADLQRAAPEDAGFWAVHVADSQLREALRAEGRGDSTAAPAYHETGARAAREALTHDLPDPQDRRIAAQSLTSLALRELAANHLERARALFDEARAALDLPPFTGDPHATALTRTAQELREHLGEERPADRPGR